MTLSVGLRAHCPGYRRHTTHIVQRLCSMLCISRHVSDFFSILDLDWLIYLFVILLFFASFHSVSSLCLAGSVAVIRPVLDTLTHPTLGILISHFYSESFLFSVRVSLERAKNFRFTDERAEWVNVSYFIYVTAIHSLNLFAIQGICVSVCVVCDWIRMAKLLLRIKFICTAA